MHGILPALITPLTPDGNIAEGPLERLLASLYSAGVHGLYCAGNTGEGMRMDNAHRKQLLDLVLRYTPSGKQTIAHVGAADIAGAIDLARHAELAGANAISSLPPAGDFGQVRSYYHALAKATELPLLVYYFPEVAHGISTYEQIEELLGVDRIAGLKFTDFNFYMLSRISRAGKVVFNGRDESLIAGLLMGAHGGIGSFYNIVPRLLLDIFEAAGRNDWIAARLYQDRLNDLITITLRYPMLPALKAMLSWKGIDCGVSLGPVARLSANQDSSLRAELDTAGFDLAREFQAAS